MSNDMPPVLIEIAARKARRRNEHVSSPDLRLIVQNDVQQ
jgi:hypothetical protein